MYLSICSEACAVLLSRVMDRLRVSSGATACVAPKLGSRPAAAIRNSLALLELISPNLYFLHEIFIASLPLITDKSRRLNQPVGLWDLKDGRNRALDPSRINAAASVCKLLPYLAPDHERLDFFI